MTTESLSMSHVKIYIKNSMQSDQGLLFFVL